LVSICIPTYKGAGTLPATLASVLSQDYPAIEVWVVDDQSPDETAAIVAACGDPRVHYVRNGRNLGPQGNWNRCLELARGKYYKLLPHDDLLEAGAVSAQVAVLEADTAERISLVFGARRIVRPNGSTLMIRRYGARAGRVPASEAARRCVRSGGNLLGEPGNGMMRLAQARALGGYDATYPYLVDLDFWFRALGVGDAYDTGTVISAFRIGAGSWSVAIGRRQHLDYAGFVRKYAAHSALGLSGLDVAWGLARARVNTWLRAVVYRFVL
jgi:glycosyltransferase involved in cell wall biosynthesis